MLLHCLGLQHPVPKGGDTEPNMCLALRLTRSAVCRRGRHTLCVCMVWMTCASWYASVCFCSGVSGAVRSCRDIDWHACSRGAGVEAYVIKGCVARTSTLHSPTHSPIRSSTQTHHTRSSHFSCTAYKHSTMSVQPLFHPSIQIPSAAAASAVLHPIARPYIYPPFCTLI